MSFINSAFMEFNGQDIDVKSYGTRILIGTNLSEACHLRAVLQERQDSAMQGSPLFNVLHDLDNQITKAQSNVTAYTELLTAIDQKQRDEKLQASLQIAKENVSASN